MFVGLGCPKYTPSGLFGKFNIFSHIINQLNKITFKIFLFSLFFATSIHPEKKRLVILSIDGLPGYFFQKDSIYSKYTPNLNKYFSLATTTFSGKSVFPTLTYPAHTSMVTGKLPSAHGILYNSIPDPLHKYTENWYWYSEYIKSKTLYDIAKKHKLKTAAIYWPATVGARIDENIPQLWIAKDEYDNPLFRIIAGKTWNWLSERYNIKLNEKSSDQERIDAGLKIWKYKKTDLMLVYSMEVDSILHKYGMESEELINVLQQTDLWFGKFVNELDLYKKGSKVALIVVSDHGFQKSEKVCNPNLILKKMDLLGDDYWKYYFHSLGGVAILLKNENSEDLKTEEQVFLSENLKPCNITTEFSGKNISRAKSEIDKSIEAVLLSDGSIVFRNSAHGELVEDKQIFTHGFLPEMDSMRTVISVFPAIKKQPKEITDVFWISCKWLDLKCN